MNDGKITMTNYDFWSLRNSHEILAVESGDVRQMVLCAKVRLDNIATGVKDSGREKRLAYEKHNEHMYVATRLLKAAKEAERLMVSTL